MSSQGPQPVQTLGRGIDVMEILAAADRPLSVKELRERTGLPRGTIYRLLGSLDEAGLLDSQAPAGTFALNLGLLTWSRGTRRAIRSVAAGTLAELAADCGGTAFLGMADGEDVVCLASAEPPDSPRVVRYPVGQRNRLDETACGLALRAARIPTADDDPAVVEAREAGYAVSVRGAQPQTSAISVPLPGDLGTQFCLTVVFPGALPHDGAQLAKRLRRTATLLAVSS